MSFTIATTVDEALGALARGARPIAGGTDLVVAARQGTFPLPGDLVAIDRIAELATISTSDGGGLRIGAVAPHAAVMSHPEVVNRRTGIADAAALVGSPATRELGTIGGNIMNASPAMDTGAPLLTLGAEVELRSVSGVRTLPIGALWTGPGTTSARPDELCTAIALPGRDERSGSAYVRLEYRRAMEIAVVGAAAAVTLADDGTLARADIALTAVAPTIIPVDTAGLLGRGIDDTLLADVATAASERATPISDLRATDRYRRHTVGVMARRALSAATRRAAGEAIGVPVNRTLAIGAAR